MGLSLRMFAPHIYGCDFEHMPFVAHRTFNGTLT